MRWWDIERIVPVEQELFAGDPSWTAEQFWSELAGVPDTRWYVVAEDGEHLAGYAGLSVPSQAGEPADILTIAVLPDRQRRGIGTLLLDALIDEAIRREAGELMLDVRADNEPAQRLYAMSGFTRIAVRRHYYGRGRNGLVLRRRLGRR
jgi:ribosomal-protein-alanine N-acetyltransferase